MTDESEVFKCKVCGAIVALVTGGEAVMIHPNDSSKFEKTQKRF